jgi:ParB family chromosome partitioning protein
LRIPIASIRPNRLQPRRHFDPEKLSELAHSIRHNGLAQPILVSFDAQTNSYELIAGERRLRATQLAGLTEIDAIVKTPETDKQRLQLALIENLQREDLNPIDVGLGYLRLMKEFAITQTQLSEMVGKSKSAVSNTLRLLDLPEEVQKALHHGHITEGHARALLSVRNPVELIKLFHLTMQKSLSVRDVEDLSRKIQAGRHIPERSLRGQDAERKSADLRAVEESLRRIFGTKVEIRLKTGKTQGAVLIHFFSDTDLDRIVKVIIKQ